MTDKQVASKKAKQHIIYKNQAGIRVPGVTTVIGVMAKPTLIPWANKMGLEGIDTNRYVDKLANIGTLAHAMVHENLGGEKVDKNQYSPDDFNLAENSFIKYLDWKKGRTIKVIGSEIQLVSEKFQYGGTCDILAEVDGVTTLIDIKTSKAVYPEAFTQVAGYDMILTEHNYKPVKYLILRLGRNETEGFQVLGIENIELHRKRFLICKNLYDINKEIKKS